VKGSGLFIAVVGPSGAGKDTILTRLKMLLPTEHFTFPSRVISRPPDANEASIYLAADAFPAARTRCDFLIDWEAHGLCYGIPADVRGELEKGRHVIANLSRAVLPALRSTTARVLVVHVTARSEVLEQRLRARSREFDADRLARLERAEALDHALQADIRIENNGSIESAVGALMEVLMPLITQKCPSA
jgi:ribose 1,5-bisphosphokinase